MAKLTAAARRALPTAAFAAPGKRAYPVPDKNHATAALSMVSRYGTAQQKTQVRAKVAKKFPGMGKGHPTTHNGFERL